LPQFRPLNQFVITNRRTLFHKGGNQVAPVKLKVVNPQASVWDTKGQIRDTSSRWLIAHVVAFV
jgi:hypothetical protein